MKKAIWFNPDDSFYILIYPLCAPLRQAAPDVHMLTSDTR